MKTDPSKHDIHGDHRFCTFHAIRDQDGISVTMHYDDDHFEYEKK